MGYFWAFSRTIVEHQAERNNRKFESRQKIIKTRENYRLQTVRSFKLFEKKTVINLTASDRKVKSC